MQWGLPIVTSALVNTEYTLSCDKRKHCIISCREKRFSEEEDREKRDCHFHGGPIWCYKTKPIKVGLVNIKWVTQIWTLTSSWYFWQYLKRKENADTPSIVLVVDVRSVGGYWVLPTDISSLMNHAIYINNNIW